MKRRVGCLVLAMSMSACGIDAGDLPPDELGTSTAALCTGPTIPAAPPTPANPTRYVRSTPLFPSGALSAFTVVQPDPTGAPYFLAWGYDLARGKNDFFVRGSQSDYDTFNAQAAAQSAVITRTNPIGLGDGSQGQPRGPGPGGPGPVGTPWQIANQIVQIGQGTASCGAIPPTPAIPGSATEWKTFAASNRDLFTVKNDSAFTVVMKDPAAPNGSRFIAWGFDVKQGINTYFVKGYYSDYSDFRSKLARDVSRVAMNNPSFVGEGTSGQVGKLPRPGGPPGDEAYGIAFNTFKINH